jgi:AcrR family transcriptional regulator
MRRALETPRSTLAPMSPTPHPAHSTAPARPARSRPGGRTARNRDSILRATNEILRREGYEHLSVAAVAAEAHVAETTIYRRWPSKAHLAVDAIAELVTDDNPVPDTGSLERDLRTFLTQIVNLLEQPSISRLVRTSISLQDSDPAIGQLVTGFWKARFATATAIVQRAVERGELPPDTDAHEVIEELASLAYFRTLITGNPLDDATVERSVSIVLRRQAPRRDE